MNNLLKALHLHEGPQTTQGKVFLRTAQQQNNVQLEEKLAIGFHAAQQEEQIDEDELL